MIDKVRLSASSTTIVTLVAIAVSLSLFFLLLLQPLTFSNAHAQNGNGINSSSATELDKPFELKIGQQETIKDSQRTIVIKFINVTEDSRCPSDVLCIQQGHATIKVSAEVKGETSVQQLLLSSSSTVNNNDNINAKPELFSHYEIKMLRLDPYPISTVQTKQEDYVAKLVVSKVAASANPSSALVKATGDYSNHSIAVISGWSVEKGKGTLVLLDRGEGSTNADRSLVRFVPYSPMQCSSAQVIFCMDGSITETKGIISQGALELELLDNNLLNLKAGNIEHILDVHQAKTKPSMQQQPQQQHHYKTTVILSEGERNGPLLVQEIGRDYVKGLRYIEYPLARLDGVPVTLHIGDKVSNGCTITLTLIDIQHDKAIFSKTVELNKPCPL